jgi:hypothetical protein
VTAREGVGEPDTSASGRDSIYSAGDGSASSTSVNTASSPGVGADPVASERLLEPERPSRSRGPPLPVNFEMLYVEKRLEARRSRVSLFFNAASELADFARHRLEKVGMPLARGLD